MLLCKKSCKHYYRNLERLSYYHISRPKDHVLEFFKLSEQDPNGVAQHEPGAKLDQGKVDAGLVLESFPNALLAVAKVATFGANKYTRGGWKEVENGMVRYKAAEMRHKLWRHAGEEYDSDSTFPHLYHEVWNALAQLEFYIKEKGKI